MAETRPKSPPSGAPSRGAPSARRLAREGRAGPRSPPPATSATEVPRRRGWRAIPAPLRWVGAIVCLLVLAVAIFLALFQWNWLRPPIDNYLSARMNRQVVIHGDLSAHLLTWTPNATANNITVGQPTWGGQGQMATLPRLTIAIDLKSLLGGKVVITLVDAERPSLDLRRNSDGHNNWTFGDPNAPPQPLKLPPIRHLNIVEGRLVLDDAQRRLHFVGQISSNEELTGYGRGRFSLSGKGALNSTPFLAEITGGPLINVNPDQPYPFKSDVRAGATHIVAQGTISRPFDLGALEATGRITGADLADLYALTGFATPSSPPYDIAAHISRNGERFDIAGLHGRIGGSDISGHLLARKRDGRNDLSGDLASRRLNLADMSALIGGAPRGALKGAITSPTQQAEAAKLTAEHRVLPDARLDMTRFRQMDADVRYHAETVNAGPLPIRQMSIHARLDHGLLTLDPLTLTLPQGALAGTVSLDARQATPITAINLALTHARVQELLPATKGAPPLEGDLQARARLTGAGDSVRSAAANANGMVAVVIPQGQMRRLLATEMGLDVGRTLFLYLSGDKKPTPVRCAVAEFKASNGVMTVRRLLIDTGAMQAQGRGTVDLRNETLSLELNGKPKHFSLLHIAAPITLTGRFDAPKVGVKFEKALPQLGAAAGLGFLAPPAALLPFISFGTKDADCGALLAEADGDGAPVGH